MISNLQARLACLAARWPGFREVAVYAAFATAWIVGSDWLLGLAVQDHFLAVELGTAKGLLFVLVTAWLLYRAHSALQREIENRRCAEERLQRTIADLESFSYSISHDLRGPLAAISSFAGYLQETEAAALSERGRHKLGRITAGAERMERMIGDILACSRAERAEMQWRRIELSPLVAEVVAELKESWPAARVTVGPLPSVNADSAMLRLVLCNLIGNALKFSGRRADAQVEISATLVRRGAVEVTVRDNGAGFDMAYSGKLFGLFQRLHSESEFPGTGVGLAIVKRLVSRHGGAVRAESVAGGWTTFSFTLGTGSDAHADGGPCSAAAPLSLQIN
jgi:light-regulated signal transduction histidine kinase (bacteriophytochrome)